MQINTRALIASAGTTAAVGSFGALAGGADDTPEMSPGSLAALAAIATSAGALHIHGAAMGARSSTHALSGEVAHNRMWGSIALGAGIGLGTSAAAGGVASLLDY